MKSLFASPILAFLFFFSLPTIGLGQDSSIAPMWEAIKKNDALQLEQLLSSKRISKEQLNPKCPPTGNCSPLMVALSRKSSFDIIEVLVEYGADVNVGGSDAKGNTPLLTAMLHGDKELIAYFLSKGADVNKANKLGASPFFGACVTGDTANIKLFLAHGAKVNGVTSLADPLRETDRVVHGITALMMAAADNNTKISDLLIANGATIGLKDSLGRTAADYRLSAKKGADSAD